MEVPPDSPLIAEVALAEVGTKLARVRIDAGLSVEDVARHLCLTTTQIHALERGDHSGFSGPTYVRGYLKSYCQKVGVDPAALLPPASFVVMEPRDGLQIFPPTSQKEITSGHRNMLMTTASVLVLMLLLAVAWWNAGGHPARPDTVSAPSSGPGILPGGLPESAPVARVDTDAPPATEVLSAGKVALTWVESTPGSHPTAAVGPLIANFPAPAPTPLTGSAAADALPADGRVRLSLRARADSWVDARDARGKRLIYRVLSAGTEITLVGVEPLRVFVGNADGVDVLVAGQVYDYSAWRHGVGARFTWPVAARGGN